MDILTAETFFILTQPRCFSAWLILRLANMLVSSPPTTPSLATENELGSTLILGKPEGFLQIKSELVGLSRKSLL